VIELRDIRKVYGGERPALDGVSLGVAKGEFLFLSGPSGAGKSTLLRLLVRAEQPTSGTVIVEGREVGTLPASEVPSLRRRIGYVFQDFKLLPRRSVFENVALVARISGRSEAEQRLRTHRVLKRVGLENKSGNAPLQLSGGEQQRVALARALVNDPAVLLADEPTGNLDPDLAVEMLSLIREINNRGTTVLVATHDPGLISRFGRRVVTLREGRVHSDTGEGLVIPRKEVLV